MQILIEKDGATRIPKEVADEAEAMSFQERGFGVLVVGEDGSTAPLSVHVSDDPGEVPPIKTKPKKPAPGTSA